MKRGQAKLTDWYKNKWDQGYALKWAYIEFFEGKKKDIEYQWPGQKDIIFPDIFGIWRTDVIRENFF